MATSSTSTKVNGKTRAHATRRKWSIKEEQCLIVALKEICTRGWKCENGFKTGYLSILEQYMSQAFPGTDLKANAQINSKIHVWKKQYGSLSTMLTRSGFGWCNTTNTLEVFDDQVWNEYIKTDSYARTMRHKSWPFYNDWTLIVGKDRATGENAEAFVDAVKELITNDKGKSQTSNGGDYVPVLNSDNAEEDDSDFMSNYPTETTSTDKGKNKVGKKRKRTNDEFEGHVLEMVSDFFDKTDVKLGDLVNKIGYQHDASELRKKVFDAVEKVCGLDVEEKLRVTKVICNNPEYLDIFFPLNEENKMTMVKMIIEGRF